MAKSAAVTGTDGPCRTAKSRRWFHRRRVQNCVRKRDRGDRRDVMGTGERPMQLRVAVIASFSVVAGSSLAHGQGVAADGEALFKKNCAVCHTTEAGKNKIGPSLNGIVARHSASLPDFQYSDAMKKADKVLDEQTLDADLAYPRALVPGTNMIFVGLKNDEDRQNVIAYLNTQK